MPKMSASRCSLNVALIVALSVASLSVVSRAQTVCPSVPTPGPNRVELDLTADGMYFLYVDGALTSDLPYYDNATAADSLPLPPYTRLLAINAIAFGSQGGLLVSVNGGAYLVSSSAWKCHTLLVSGWDQLGFDDSSWADAVEIGTNGNNPVYDYGCIAGISPNAYWIWTIGYQPPSQHRNVWCRGYLPLCTQNNPCMNGGTCLENSAAVCACPIDWTGDQCDTDLNPCRSAPCYNGGTCTNGEGVFSCQCTANYTGSQCETMLNACQSSPCINGGTCVNGGTFYRCNCLVYYTGQHCETAVPPDCGSILHNAVAANLPSGWSIGCYLGVGDEVYWNTPCFALLQGLSYYGSSDRLLAAGGNYGCYTTRDGSSTDVYNACIDNYQHDIYIRECSSCNFMAVCVRFP